MNDIFNLNIKKWVCVNAKNIIWDLDGYDADLPDNIYDIEVEIDFDVDPYERWCEGGGETGFDILYGTLVDQLSDEYGFCVISVENVEIIKVIRY